MKTRLFIILTAVFAIACAMPAFAGGISTVADFFTSDAKGTDAKGTDAEAEGIPYIDFYADLTGRDPAEIDLSKAAYMNYSIQECEFGYPVQTICDEESLRSAEEFFRTIYVTGEPDGIFSTEGGQGLSLLDEEGNVIISIFIQAGMIDTSDGRRAASGLSGISEIPGLMTPGDWEAYYEEQEQAEEEYCENHEFQYPCSLMEAEGKAAFEFYQKCTAEDIQSIYFFHNGKNKTVTDRETIEKIYDSICSVQVTGPGKDSRWAEKWSITIFYVPEGGTFGSEIHLAIHDGVLSTDNQGFELEGLEGVLEASGWEEAANIVIK